MPAAGCCGWTTRRIAPLAVKTFERIGSEAAARWPSVALAIHHRTGRLAIGEASVVIAAASPHRADAFAACRYAIERVKQIAPVWKHEHFEGGDVWIEGATADPDDESATAGRIGARMLVTVRLFARLRELAGASELRRELPDGARRAYGVGAPGPRHSRRSRDYEPRDLVRRQRGVRAADDAAEARRRGRVPAAGVWRVD